MSKFLGGLQHDIQDRLEMQHYVDLQEMLHQAILIEQQLKRKSSTRPSNGAGNHYYSNGNYSREEKPRVHGDSSQSNTTRLEARPFPAKQSDKGKSEARTSSIKCYKCQGIRLYANKCTNKRVMVLKEDGQYESEEELADPKPKEEEVVELPAKEIYL
ncbi:hypothetical protein V5N11_013631 [Cardamine amara subsp. amara]|uniref:Gag-pol polyprotein n=1 Tax=Cardamine amara subsp. amara TaxID=228776 RepID=A0ABD0ZTL1_CARAN